MEPEITNRQDRKPLWVKLLLFGGFNLLGFFVVFLLFVNQRSRNQTVSSNPLGARQVAAEERAAESEVHRAVTELRAAGLPVDESSLQTFHRAGTDPTRTAQWLRIDEQIASDEFARAAEAMPYQGKGTDIPLPGPPWTEQQEVAEAPVDSRRAISLRAAPSRGTSKSFFRRFQASSAVRNVARSMPTS